MANEIVSTYTSSTSLKQAAADVINNFGDVDPTLIILFSAHTFDGAQLSKILKDKYPNAVVAGCSTAGEFTEKKNGVNGIAAMALSKKKVKHAAAALADFSGGVEPALKSAAAKLETDLGVEIRKVDPNKYIGIVLFEGLNMREEKSNEILGNIAPLLSFVGGSAGDNLEFKQTQVYLDGKVSKDGAVVILMEMAVPFTILKSCSFEPTENKFSITKADDANRVVYEFNGRPVAEAYASAVNVSSDSLDSSIFMEHPVGIMIDGAPWIRSPQQMTDDGGLKFYCNISEGMDVHVMNSTDLIAETKAAVDAAEKKLGRIDGAIMFNCILRRLELDASGKHEEFLNIFSKFPTAGFHTYGESWLGHINQTITAIMIA